MGNDATRVDAPHSGIAAVRKWLARPPAKADSLRLEVREESGIVQLASWDGADLRPAIAADIIEAVDAHAAATQHDVCATMVFARGERVVATRLVRRRAEAAHDSPPVLLSGSVADQAAQAQRHLEAMTRLYTRGLEGAQQQVLRLSEATMQVCERVVQRLASVEEELRSTNRRLLRAQSEQVAPPEDGESDALGEQLGALAKIAVPMVVQSLSSPPKPAAPPKPNGAAQ